MLSRLLFWMAAARNFRFPQMRRVLLALQMGGFLGDCRHALQQAALGSSIYDPQVGAMMALIAGCLLATAATSPMLSAGKRASLAFAPIAQARLHNAQGMPAVVLLQCSPVLTQPTALLLIPPPYFTVPTHSPAPDPSSLLHSSNPLPCS